MEKLKPVTTDFSIQNQVAIEIRNIQGLIDIKENQILINVPNEIAVGGRKILTGLWIVKREDYREEKTYEEKMRFPEKIYWERSKWELSRIGDPTPIVCFNNRQLLKIEGTIHRIKAPLYVWNFTVGETHRVVISEEDPTTFLNQCALKVPIHCWSVVGNDVLFRNYDTIKLLGEVAFDV